MTPTVQSTRTLTVHCSGCMQEIIGSWPDNESFETCAERIRRPHKDVCNAWRPREPRPTGIERQIARAVEQSTYWLQDIATVMKDGEPETFLECFLPRAFRVWLHRRARRRR